MSSEGLRGPGASPAMNGRGRAGSAAGTNAGGVERLLEASGGAEGFAGARERVWMVDRSAASGALRGNAAICGAVDRGSGGAYPREHGRRALRGRHGKAKPESDQARCQAAGTGAGRQAGGRRAAGGGGTAAGEAAEVVELEPAPAPARAAGDGEAGEVLAVKRRAKLTRHRRPILTRLVPSFLPGSLFPVARSAGGVFGRRKDGWKARLRFSAAG